MIKHLSLALALMAGASHAEDVAFFNGDLTLSLPIGTSVGRSFGEESATGIYAIDVGIETIEDIWTAYERADELPDMDRMEAAFGLTFPSADCADYSPSDSVLPTRCKPLMGMSLLAIERSAEDSGERLGVQLGMLAADVDTAWATGDFSTLLSAFCTNRTHPHRTPAMEDKNSIICTSDRPALAPHFLSFRLLMAPDHAVIMYAQNIEAETDVIMRYGVDNFLALIENATDIETTLFSAAEDYKATALDGGIDVLLFDKLNEVQIQ